MFKLENFKNFKFMWENVDIFAEKTKDNNVLVLLVSSKDPGDIYYLEHVVDWGAPIWWYQQWEVPWSLYTQPRLT